MSYDSLRVTRDPFVKFRGQDRILSVLIKIPYWTCRCLYQEREEQDIEVLDF